MDDPRLLLPDDFDDHAWEVEAKGWYAGAELVVADRRVRVVFFDPVRLSQEVDATLRADRAFVGVNIIVVSRLTRPVMEAAARDPQVIAEIALSLDARHGHAPEESL